MFSTIAQTIGKLFGTDKAIQSVVDNVSNGLDKLVYTDEEKAVDAAKDRSEARKMIIRWMEATKGQNLARRIIALAIVFTWLAQYIISQLTDISAIWVANTAIQLNLHASSKILVDGAKNMNQPVMVILGFYFAAPYLGQIFNKKGK